MASGGREARRAAARRNGLSPLRFILAFGVVSMLADFVYEGARGIVGPYLATFGVSAAVVGVVTGAGEAAALVFRLFTGPLSDRTRKYWPITIVGYAITVIAVPLMAAAQTFWQAAMAVIGERFGKAVRTPARDTMLAQASTSIGRGKAFALHEALDQSGALLGPLLVAGMVALSGYRLGFAVLAIPGVLVIGTLWALRRAVPDTSIYLQPAEQQPPRQVPQPADAAGERAGWRLSGQFWGYTGFTALTMLGYATFGILGYHLQIRHVVPDWQIPIIFAAAMGIDALAALGSGWVYDRWGLRGLIVMPVLAAAVPFASFTTTPVLIWIGALIWGTAMGVQESTMRAAVADLVPPERRGTGYGIFTAVYGLAWLAGSVIIGVLYDSSHTALLVFVVATQAAALVCFPLAVTRRAP